MPSSFFAIPAAALAGLITSIIGYIKFGWPMGGIVAFGLILLLCIIWFLYLLFK